MDLLTKDDIDTIRSLLDRQRFSTEKADRAHVEEAVATLYKAIGLAPPLVLWLLSPSALEYIWGLVSGAIPSWFHPRRLNPDLHAHDPDIPKSFWEGIDDILPFVGRNEILHPDLESTDKGSDLLRYIEEILPFEINTHMHHFWPDAHLWIGGYEPSTWRALLAESIRYAMPQQTVADLWLAWMSSASGLPQACGDDAAFVQSLNILSRNCSAWYPFHDVVLAVEPPMCVYHQGVPHREDGPAVTWRDGVRSWYLNGVLVPRRIVEASREELQAQEVLKATNAEVRREIVRKIGIERVCRDLGAQCVDREGDYELLLLELGLVEDDAVRYDETSGKLIFPGLQWNEALGKMEPALPRGRPYLKMKNPSTGTYHVEGVHPDCRTVAEALAWRNGTGSVPELMT